MAFKCNKCKYVIDFDNIKHIYLCIYCGKYFCKSCCVDCKFCKIYNEEYITPNCHCFDCGRYFCLKNILRDFKNPKNKNNNKNNNKIENIKERLIISYKHNVHHGDELIMYKDFFIDELNIVDELKNILINHYN